ncbi:hypothetical protein NHJ13734_004477 [Beauveria thailandica]
MPHLEVEPITSAQIMPAFRPLLISGEQVHKMVDYALVLGPSDALQALINRFLEGEP